ncbi:transketolase [Niallia sp. HCP3S3_B10]|uniref:transketolase n=1 Tax=Niallia sp. HCP3S3_B10 TaxID=3438944 RepID=UPI003F88EB19
MNYSTLIFDETKINELQTKIKTEIITMTTIAKSGHPGSSISSMNIFLAAFLVSMKEQNIITPEDALLIKNNPFTDRFIISHGHTSPAWYSMLGNLGLLQDYDYLTTLRVIGSKYTGHLEQNTPFVDWSTGSLGQGLSAATAKAFYLKNNDSNRKVFAFMGDGEQAKGQIGEARRFINKFNLTNLISIIDYNGIQINGEIEDIMPSNIADDWKSAGFKVLDVNATDWLDLVKAITYAYHDNNSNYLLLVKTVSGEGVSFMENNNKYVSGVLSNIESQKAFSEIGATMELSDLDKQRIEKKQIATARSHWPTWREFYHKQEWEKETEFYNVNDIVPRRQGYGDSIKSMLKENDAKLFIVDCDLAPAFTISDLSSSNNFIQSGIQEHHAVTFSGSLSREDLTVFISSFGRFILAEPYNQHLLNALNKTNLKTFFSHVGFAGEDGPTHHFTSFISLIRSIPDSHLLIPADANQVKHIVRYVANNKGNYFISLGRVPTKILSDTQGNPLFGEKYIFQEGTTDVLKEGKDGTIVTYGSLTNRAIEAADKMKDLNFDIGVVSVSSPYKINDDFWEKTSSKKVVIYEEHDVETGLGNILSLELQKRGYTYSLMGVKGIYPSGFYDDILDMSGLSVNNLVENIKMVITNNV